MKKDISVFVGSRIRDIRKKNKFTQKELGKKLGVKHNTISSYENGTNEPDQDVLFRLAHIFNVSINDFFPNNKEVKSTPTSYTYFPTAISAGLPLSVDGITEASKISISDEVLGKYANDKDLYFARANGDSMDKLFKDGSLLAIKPVALDNLKNGDIVVFSDNHEYSVKHYHKYGNTLVFTPNSKNTAHKEQEYSVNDNITIHGKVVTYIVNLD